MRLAAFRYLKSLQQSTNVLTNIDLNAGFQFEGERFPLVNPQQGIYKPKEMQFLLSVKTVFPKPGGRVWYDDQRNIHQRIFDSSESVDYDFMGSNPESAQNRWLREAYEHQIPIVYFLGIAPMRYDVIMPTFVTDWNANRLKSQLTFGYPLQDALTDETTLSYSRHLELPDEDTRRYALGMAKQRLHQTSFREALVQAYGGRCAVSRIPEPLLLDAAHIIPDRDVKLGLPVVPNGLPLSKIHHAAFDSNLIGIDPDYRIHVSDRLLNNRDGPLLESLKQLKGEKILLPNRNEDWPDPDRLGLRFEQFRSTF